MAWWKVARSGQPYNVGSARRAPQHFGHWRPMEHKSLIRLTRIAYQNGVTQRQAEVDADGHKTWRLESLAQSIVSTTLLRARPVAK